MKKTFGISFVILGCIGAALLVAGQQPLPLTASFWSGPQKESPKLLKEGSFLDFTLRPATSSSGKPTLALLAAARFPGRLVERYGGRIASATEIVAINAATGTVFSRPAEREGAVPLSTVLSAARPKSNSGATVDSAEVWFNADLRSHLDLPAAAGVYHVFLWADDLTSPMHVADVPAGGESTVPAPTAETARGEIHFRESRLSPHSERALAMRSASDRIYGTVAVRDLSSPAKALTLLALNSHTRELSWKNAVVHSKELKASGGHFDFDAAAFFKLPQDDRERLFVVAVIGRSLSNVIEVTAKK